MSRIFSILLVEDDPVACKEISSVCDELEDISLLGVTNSSSEALKIVLELMPDAIILDLELYGGDGNGLGFLQELRRSYASTSPYILVTTNNSSTITYDAARKLGADFIMPKHQIGYSSKNAVEFLRLIKDIIQMKKDSSSDNGVSETLAQKAKRITRKISSELDNIGISPKSVGYQYLVDAIELIIEDPVYNLCRIIGEKYSKTDASIERAMQNAINRAWRITDIACLLEHYTAKVSSEKGVPTSTELIYYYARKIKNEL